MAERVSAFVEIFKGKCDADRRAVVPAGGELDFPAMFLYHPLAESETESCPLSGWLGRKEGLEDVLQVCFFLLPVHCPETLRREGGANSASSYGLRCALLCILLMRLLNS